MNLIHIRDLERTRQIIDMFSFTEVIQADVAKLKLQIDKGTSNSTNTNTASITNQSLSDLQQIEVRFDSLESTLDTYGAALSNIEGVTSVREELFQNYTYRTEETINELQVNLTAQGAKFIALNETIYETVTQLKARVKDLNNSSQTGISMLSQLEADMNSSKAIIQDHDLRIKELKTNRTAGRESIINLETEIANLEANLTSVSTIIKTQGEFLISMNETLIQMGAVNEQSSTSLKAYMERQLVQLEIEFKNRLLKIESNATTNRKDIEVKYLNITDKMTLLETNVLSQMGKSENLSSNLANLEFDIGTITATLHINHDDIVEINEKIRHLNDTLTDSFDMAQYLISNITYLELEIGAMKAEIQNNSHGIVSAVANFQELDKSTSDSISRLDTGLTDITGNQVLEIA